MSGKGTNPKEQIPCPKCGSRVQRRNMRKHERSMHFCPYCSAEKCRTYSTFLDWRNHLLDTHEHCLENDDPLQREEYAAGFKLDRWERFHYGQYQGQEEGELPGPPSTIRLPHTKGTTPDRDVTPEESERAGSDHGDSGQEEGEVTQAEGNEPRTFTQMKSRDSDSRSDDTNRDEIHAHHAPPQGSR